MTVPVDLIVGGGTVGLIGFLLVVVWRLWTEHLAADARERARGDEAMAGWREQTAETNAGVETLDRTVGLLERQAADRPAAYGGRGGQRA